MNRAPRQWLRQKACEMNEFKLISQIEIFDRAEVLSLPKKMVR